MARITYENSIKPTLNTINNMQSYKVYIVRGNGEGYTLTARLVGKGTGEFEVYHGTVREIYAFLKGMIETYRLIRESRE